MKRSDSALFPAVFALPTILGIICLSLTLSTWVRQGGALAFDLTFYFLPPLELIFGVATLILFRREQSALLMTCRLLSLLGIVMGSIGLAVTGVVIFVDLASLPR